MNINLLDFQRPARYIGKEWNLTFKNPARCKLRVCLCFPQIYEVGMSNLGFRIVYHLFNSDEEIFCERCFLPGKDLERYLFKEKNLLFSLETRTPLNEFDVVGFCLNYELNFLNFLKMLMLGGIELFSLKRKKPLLIAGGLINPEPVAEFIDVFFWGEFEEKAKEFLDRIKRIRTFSKKELLLSLAQIKGVYIPCFYEKRKEELIPRNKYVSFPVERVYVRNLDKNFSPQTWLVPYLPLVFDRLQIEVARGCPHRCKFCQARCVYFPYREKTPERILEEGVKLYRKTGYEGISLLSLSIVNYSRIILLLKEITSFFKEERVNISLPSLRPEPEAIEILKILSSGKKPGLTIAIEAASPRLRKEIGKYIDMEALKELIRVAAYTGYRRFKFYFMLGLPGEEKDDILLISDLMLRLATLYRREKGFFPAISLSCSFFIPKPFTEFEFLPFKNKQELEKRKKLLFDSMNDKKFIKLNFPRLDTVLIEALLSRGDRALGKLLVKIACFDLEEPNQHSLNFLFWHKLAKDENLTLDFYLEKPASFKHLSNYAG